MQKNELHNINEQSTGRNPSSIEFDGMEHDLTDEGYDNTKEYSHATYEVATSTSISVPSTPNIFSLFSASFAYGLS